MRSIKIIKLIIFSLLITFLPNANTMEKTDSKQYKISWNYDNFFWDNSIMKNSNEYIKIRKDQIQNTSNQLNFLFKNNKNLFYYYCFYVCKIKQDNLGLFGSEQPLSNLKQSSYAQYDKELQNRGLLNEDTNVASKATKVLVATIVVIWGGRFLQYKIEDLEMALLIQKFNPLTIEQDYTTLESSVKSNKSH